MSDFRIASTVPPTPLRVAFARADGSTQLIGSAAAALQRSDLSRAERRAIRAMQKALRVLERRTGFNGIDDAGRGVTLVLRDADATKNGPWATNGTVTVGKSNALNRAPGRLGRDARDGVLLTVDVAIHELAHVTQFERADASTTNIHPALAEGIADAAAILATGDRSLGEGFFRTRKNGPQSVIRSLRAPGVDSPMGESVSNFRRVQRGKVQEHAAGGVVAATFDHVWRRLGRSRAESLLWTVIRDVAAWRGGGSWQQLAASMVRSARTLWPNDVTAERAVAEALAATKLSEALPERSDRVAA